MHQRPLIPTSEKIILDQTVPLPNIALTKSKLKIPMLPQFNAPIITRTSASLSRKLNIINPSDIRFILSFPEKNHFIQREILHFISNYSSKNSASTSVQIRWYTAIWYSCTSGVSQSTLIAISKSSPIFPPLCPVSAIDTMPSSRAAIPAHSTFCAFPEVDKPISTSPALPSPQSCCA